MTPTVLSAMRELHSRIGDGIRVRLLWCEREGHVAVTVDDTRTGDFFVVQVRDGDRPLEVFHHPYAYAAWRGVPTRPAPVPMRAGV